MAVKRDVALHKVLRAQIAAVRYRVVVRSHVVGLVLDFNSQVQLGEFAVAVPNQPQRCLQTITSVVSTFLGHSRCNILDPSESGTIAVHRSVEVLTNSGLSDEEQGVKEVFL